MPIIYMLLDIGKNMFFNAFLWRAISIGFAWLGFLLFLGSTTHETGSSTIYPMVIPIVGSIATILFLSKRVKNIWILVLGFSCIVYSMAMQQESNGTFIHYTITGLGTFILFFNALRPWRN